MYRNIISLTSVLALFVGVTGYPNAIHAHEGDKLCNVLLDGDGEPVKESDNDVVDHSNSHACAATDDDKNVAEAEAEAEVEKAPEPVVAVVQEPVTLEPMTVYFDTGEDQLSAGAGKQVQAFAEQLFETNPKSIKVVGHTDTSGSADLNAKLSKARAASVIASLVEAGVSSDVIDQDASGEGSLAVATPDGTREANNRRVVITPEY